MVKIHPPIVAIPKGLVFQKMFTKKGIDSYIVAVHNKAILACVLVPPNIFTMVGTPQPRVIDIDVFAIDNQTTIGFALAITSNPEKRYRIKRLGSSDGFS